MAKRSDMKLKFDVNQRKHPFPSNLALYDYLLDKLESSKESESASTEFLFQKLTVLESRSYEKLAGSRDSTSTTQQLTEEVTSDLSQLDEALRAASGFVAIGILRHFICQLYFQMGMLILQKSQASHGDQQEFQEFAAALFVLAYNRTKISVVKCKRIFRSFVNCGNCFIFILKASDSPATGKKFLESLNTRASFRRSQCGHCVLVWEARKGRDWVIDTAKRYDTVEGKRKLFDVVFGGQNKKRSPFFSETSGLIQVTSELPSLSDLRLTDCHTVQRYGCDVCYVVWLGVRYLMMHRRLNELEFVSDFNQILSQCHFLRNIPFASSSWNSSAPETLAALDIEAFIYASIYCHVSCMDETELTSILPISLTQPTCSKMQVEWWSAAFQLITGSAKENLEQTRTVVQRGLEVIRLSGNNHGVPLELVSKLARTFAFRAAKARPFPTVQVPALIDTEVL
jgi:hypothetical protein